MALLNRDDLIDSQALQAYVFSCMGHQWNWSIHQNHFTIFTMKVQPDQMVVFAIVGLSLTAVCRSEDEPWRRPWSCPTWGWRGVATHGRRSCTRLWSRYTGGGSRWLALGRVVSSGINKAGEKSLCMNLSDLDLLKKKHGCQDISWLKPQGQDTWRNGRMDVVGRTNTTNSVSKREGNPLGT